MQKTDYVKVSGSGHWKAQRFSAIVLVGLFVWIVFFSVKIAMLNSIEVFFLIRKPLNMLFITAFTLVSIYHGFLGVQIIFEDYIKNLLLRKLLINLTKAVSFFSFAVFFTALMCNLFLLK